MRKWLTIIIIIIIIIIIMYLTHNEGTSVIAERFIKTLKAKIYKK